MSALPAAALSRLRVVHRSFLTRRGGRHTSRAALSVEYRPPQQNAIRNGTFARVIDAEALHGDEQKFWLERRAFYRKPVQYMPTWDRSAHVLALVTREVPRVPQEMAFRLMAVFLKLMLMPRIVMGAEMMLPAWMATNAEGIVKSALQEEKGEKEGKKKEGGGGTNADGKKE